MIENLTRDDGSYRKKSRFFLFFLLLVFLLTALTGLAFTTGKNANKTTYTPYTPSAVTTPNAQTQLFFVPSVQTGLTGTIFAASVSISTGANKLSGVQFSLNFDPKKVQVVDMVPGNFFANPTVLLKKIDNQKGQIDYALGSLIPQSGENILAALSLKLVSITTSAGTQISFSNTKAADINEGSNNVLKSATGLTLTIEQK